jgi:hypothetical protein
VFAALKEHSAKIQFKKVDSNPARLILTSVTPNEVELDTEIDLMFTCPGILLSGGSQRLFTKIINNLVPVPPRKTTLINLERVRYAIEDHSNFSPTEVMIWKSIRSTTLQQLTREFFWKCLHNIFRVGEFWDHIPNSEIFGRCNICKVPETLEHIALECDAPEQHLIWDLTRKLWSRKYPDWPKLSWGLILGCNLAQFKTAKGVIIPEKGRLFAI